MFTRSYRGALVGATAVSAAAVVLALAGACSHLADDHDGSANEAGHGSTSSGAGAGGTGGQGGDMGGTGGTGGIDPCGGCGGGTPYCDEPSGDCVACLGHEHCTEAGAAQCDGGSCVACTEDAHCAGVADAGVCDAGTCVECTAGDPSACSGTETCDLVDRICVDVAPHTVGNCQACTNDEQCGNGFRCISMQLQQASHGYYCLAEPSPTCPQPFQVPINVVSINGVAATDYCGIDEDTATCEAVLALIAGWHCSGNEGMCSSDGVQTEVPVPGALCESVGLGGEACTYACSTVAECPTGGPGSTCGTGAHQPPGWCGG